MNRRIAKKILSVRASGWRWRRWREGYGPDDPSRIGRRAQDYLDRHENTYKKTRRVVRRFWSASQSASEPDPAVVEELVAAWDALRPYLWHRFRGARWQWRVRPLTPIPGESIEEGRVVGEREIRDLLEQGDESVFGFVVGTLAYCSDRWCVSRIGRMDAMIDHLRGSP